MTNVLLGVTGSIAAILTPKLQLSLNEEGFNVRTVVTPSSLRFRKKEYDWGIVNTDQDEWNTYYQNKSVLHIDLVKWADIFLIAPATANTLSKIKNKIADNLLTNCALAWNYDKPLIVAPAMNTQMWKNLGEDSFFEGMDVSRVSPQEKTLYCGDTGIGAMAEIDDIISVTRSVISLRNLSHFEIIEPPHHVSDEDL